MFYIAWPFTLEEMEGDKYKKELIGFSSFSLTVLFLPRDQNAGQNINIQISNKSLKAVEQFKCLGTTLTNQNSIHEEIKSRLKSGNACCHSVQNLFSSSLLSKNVNIKIHRTIIMPAVLYGCEGWSLTLRDECRLRVFENKVLRRIFGPKRDKMTGDWRILHKKELYAQCSSPNIIRVIKSRRPRWAGHVSHMGESRGAYKVLVGKPEGRRPLGRPRRRWEDNIKMFLREVGVRGMDWIDLAQDRDRWWAVVSVAMNLWVA
jgi:hypothetical protein